MINWPCFPDLWLCNNPNQSGRDEPNVKRQRTASHQGACYKLTFVLCIMLWASKCNNTVRELCLVPRCQSGIAEIATTLLKQDFVESTTVDMEICFCQCCSRLKWCEYTNKTVFIIILSLNYNYMFFFNYECYLTRPGYRRHSDHHSFLVHRFQKFKFQKDKFI